MIPMMSRPSNGKSVFESTASELGDIVLKDRTPKAARAYLGWVAWLGPELYQPPQEVLGTALDLAVQDMENAKLPPINQNPNYEFFRDVAARYGLNARADQYNSRIIPVEATIEQELN
ncbi:hypothetical protein HYX03_04285 [Candidatus Woesearchaeota archaeon]|nr:hypothetical protein [Candidatus Woesearchaeota archaeon]